MRVGESVVNLVEWCRRHAVPLVLGALVLTGLFGFYAATTIGMDTNTDHLLSDKLPWRQREIKFDALFPQNSDTLAVVVDGATPGLAEKATATLTRWMTQHPELYRSVRRPDGGPFFDRNGLLYLKTDELQSLSDQLVAAQPLLGTLAADPSLRGLFNALGLALEGVQHGETDLTDLDKPLAAVADATEAVVQGHTRPFPWDSLLTGKDPSPQELRRFILVQPVLDYSDLQPGRRASQAIRDVARELGFVPDEGVRVRLTGSVALSDEEFASVAQGAGLATGLSFVLVCLILFLAVRSFRVIAAILGTLLVGLVWSAAFAAATVGTLNLLSVAFAVLFVGIAVDFSIQFCIRYRDERYRAGDFTQALRRTARRIGGPLLLAAASTAVGFYAFLPTAYRGVSELGLIAGSSMLIAILLNLTLLPALLTLLRPGGERAPVGFGWASPMDRLLLRRRGLALGIAGLVALACLALAPKLRFDFNPLSLKDPHTESMATLLELMSDPLTTPFTVEALTPSPEAAAALGKQLEALPEVGQAVSILGYVPEDQPAKLAILKDLDFLLGSTLSPPQVQPPPTEAEVLATIRATMAKLNAIGARLPDDATPNRLERALAGILATPSKVASLSDSLIGGLQDELDRLRVSLTAEPVTLATLPDDLKQAWIAPDGEARIEVFPKAGALDDAGIKHFVDAVRQRLPDAVGAAVSIVESGRTIVDAFLTAGVLAIASITLLLLLVLRRIWDVMLVLAPLTLAALLTIATTVLIDLPINFANIIALPLLFGIGVAFDIYFVMNWRAGLSAPLASATTRAVLFSALTTTTAFGSLALSPHPGTAGMGLLLTIALFYTLISTLFFLPALLGKPPAQAAAPPPSSRLDRLPRQQGREEYHQVSNTPR
jgi:hopanoid biosynthesis associated RND transporter like protein HpnN